MSELKLPLGVAQALNLLVTECIDAGVHGRFAAANAARQALDKELFAWNTRAYEPDQARIAELTEALRALIEVASRNIYPKPDVGPEHPWSVLERARAALEKRHAD
ncbi:hypothetical protein ACN6KF_003010 [Labrys sp. La1]|uniref:hypothetical protein n=1 Tax=Labrys sp. La1 TaxID=3404917 RepID=UPI003EC11CD6